MLSGMRSCFLLSFWLSFAAVACLPVQAQINGVPPSVTSIGFGGRSINGVRPSVTSLGPNGYGNDWPIFGNCCANFFLPANPNPPAISGRRHHHHGDDGSFAVGVVEPVYIPYAVPYAPESDDDSPDADYVHAPGARNADPATRRAGGRDSAPQADASAKPTPDEAVPSEQSPSEPEEPVAAQPSTVLVFKDGHRSDVLNYAIVGDTLFDFDLEAGRTHKILLADLDLPATRKANDDRGVDFQTPAGPARQ